jgi:SAM-dependent methyltransferase
MLTTMSPGKNPKEIVEELHRDYYAAGDYSSDRYIWTIQTFLASCRGMRILEVGCGNGKLLELLKATNEVVGVDASTARIEAYAARGIEGHCMDPSSEPLPFAPESFDIVLCLETMEHMMSPYYAMLEMRRVLKSGGRLVCSVPNPIWGHIMLYPGLFEYKNFRKFLEQGDFKILRVAPWEWAPRETILPVALRTYKWASSRYVAGVLRRMIAWSWRATGHFPSFCYWLWTFEAVKLEEGRESALARQSRQTAPQG